jgi:hypothetical protein
MDHVSAQPTSGLWAAGIAGKNRRWIDTDSMYQSILSVSFFINVIDPLVKDFV